MLYVLEEEEELDLVFFLGQFKVDLGDKVGGEGWDEVDWNVVW